MWLGWVMLGWKWVVGLLQAQVRGFQVLVQSYGLEHQGQVLDLQGWGGEIPKMGMGWMGGVGRLGVRRVQNQKKKWWSQVSGLGPPVQGQVLDLLVWGGVGEG